MGVALFEVGHVAGEELDVGAADADAFDVHDDLSRDRDRLRDIFHRTPVGAAEDVGAHGSTEDR